MADRIKYDTLPGNYIDGQILYGAEVNKIVNILRTGINANKSDVDRLILGFKTELVFTTKEKADEYLETHEVEEGEYSVVMNDDKIGDEKKAELYLFDGESWAYVVDFSIVKAYEYSKAANDLADEYDGRITFLEATVANHGGRILDLEDDIEDIKDGTILVKRAERDKNNKVIDLTYLNKADNVAQSVEGKINFKRGIDLQAQKITGVANGTLNTDGANLINIAEKIEEHDLSANAHVDIREEIEYIKDGTTTVGKATKDSQNNVIHTHYATKDELTGHDNNPNAHLSIRQEIEEVAQDVARIEGRGKSYGELNYTQSQLLAMNETDRNDAILIDIQGKHPFYTLNNGDLVYTKEVDDENTHEWEYNDTLSTWVDNGAYTVQKASNSIFGLVKGDGDYVNIVNGILEILKSNYATRVGTDLSNSYTYSQLKTLIENLQADVNDRYTKSQVYTKVETNALLDELKAVYGWEKGTIWELEGVSGTKALPLADFQDYDILIVQKVDAGLTLSITRSDPLDVNDIINNHNGGLVIAYDDLIDPSNFIEYNSGLEVLTFVDPNGLYNIYGLKMNQLDASKVAYGGRTVEEALDVVEETLDNNSTNINNLKEACKNDIFNITNYLEGVWEQGSIDGNGNKTLSTLRIRTDYIESKNNYLINFAVNNGYSYGLAQYKYAGGTYTKISVEDWLTASGRVLDAQTTHIIVYLRKNDNSKITPNEYTNVSFSYYKKEGIVYGSKTNNVLDVNSTFDGFRITDNSPYFVNNTNDSIVSNFIYVENQTKITVSGFPTTIYNKWYCFTTDRTLSPASVVGVGRLLTTETNKTILIPPGAKWLIMVLGFSSDVVSNAKACYGEETTLEIFERGNIVVIDEVTINKNANYYYDNEKNNVLKRFIPFSIGTPANNLNQFDNSYGRTNFVFFTDSHIDLINVEHSFANVEDTVRFIKDSPITFDGIIHAGDIITQTGTKTTIKNNAMKFFNKVIEANIPIVYTKGNHDLNDYSNTPSNVFNDTDWGEMFYDYAETKYGIIRQTKDNSEKSTWHYLDLEEKKIRILSIDVQDTDKTTTDANGNVLYSGQKAWYISNEQLNWIADSALNFDDKEDKGWGIVVVMHQSLRQNGNWYDTSLTPAFESSIGKLFNLLKAFNTQSTYSNSYTFATNSFYNISISADFTGYASEEKKPHIICVLNGHEHFDRVQTVDGINFIWTANGSATNAYSDARLARILGTSTQNCFDILNIDTVHRKIRLFRFGAGVNCFGEGGDRFVLEGLSY